MNAKFKSRCCSLVTDVIRFHVLVINFPMRHADVNVVLSVKKAANYGSSNVTSRNNYFDLSYCYDSSVFPLCFKTFAST